MTTIETIAIALAGVEYSRDCIPAKVQAEAKSAGIVIVCGSSDDLIELYGAIRDEGDCYDGGTVLIDANGVVPSWEQSSESEDAARAYFERKQNAKAIEALWAPDEPAGASWAYKTDIPHVTFDVMEDGEIYCRGIVFALSALETIK